jgi:hypothetical protein
MKFFGDLIVGMIIDNIWGIVMSTFVISVIGLVFGVYNQFGFMQSTFEVEHWTIGTQEIINKVFDYVTIISSLTGAASIAAFAVRRFSRTINI